MFEFMIFIFISAEIVPISLPHTVVFKVQIYITPESNILSVTL